MSVLEPRADIPNDWDRSGLPGWAYTSPELLELEREVLFRRHWQLVGHVSDLPSPGSYLCFDMIGERAVVIRGRDGVVRAFHNVCRHRGSRVLADDGGTCRSAIVCPFHGWSYELDGTLRAPARPRTLPPLDPVAHGLVPIESEIWHGFVFIRFKPSDQPPVAELFARHERELAPYELESLEPLGTFWRQDAAANWKAIRDVDNEGYHVPIAHPGLQDLYGHNYFDEAIEGGTSRSVGRFNDGPGRRWSVRHYKKILPEVTALPESHRRAWIYLGLFPNLVFSLYPDAVQFYQEWPVAPGRSLQRGATYAKPDARREMKLARYLSTRIDRDTGLEDLQLTIWSSEAPRSSGFSGIILSDLEYGVRRYHDALREVMPVLKNSEEPPPGVMAAMARAAA